MAKRSGVQSIWWYEQEALEEQVRNYHTLKITRSARGQCVLFFGIICALTLLLTYFVSVADVTFGIAIIGIVLLYGPFLFFTYKGHRWAMICLLIVWAVDKAFTAVYQVSNGSSLVSSLIFLVIGAGLCLKAIQVENARRKTSQA